MTVRGRRDFLLLGWLRRSSSDPPPHARRHPIVAVDRPPPGFLRPPGAVDEPAFLDTCSRGGDCVAACPVQAIVTLGPAYGAAAEGTPAVLPRATACILCEDIPCARACPSGALRPSKIPLVRMGTALLHRGRCLAVRGESCDLCVRACPIGPLAIALERGIPQVFADVCTGCGQCEHACPTDPAAITVIPRDVERLRPFMTEATTA